MTVMGNRVAKTVGGGDETRYLVDTNNATGHAKLSKSLGWLKRASSVHLRPRHPDQSMSELILVGSGKSASMGQRRS